MAATILPVHGGDYITGTWRRLYYRCMTVVIFNVPANTRIRAPMAVIIAPQMRLQRRPYLLVQTDAHMVPGKKNIRKTLANILTDVFEEYMVSPK